MMAHCSHRKPKVDFHSRCVDRRAMGQTMNPNVKGKNDPSVRPNRQPHCWPRARREPTATKPGTIIMPMEDVIDIQPAVILHVT